MPIVAHTLPYLVLNPYALIEEANGFFFEYLKSYLCISLFVSSDWLTKASLIIFILTGLVDRQLPQEQSADQQINYNRRKMRNDSPSAHVDTSRKEISDDNAPPTLVPIETSIKEKENGKP
jgi:hypothetical protein